jgi:hypothetical protein
MRYSRTEGIGMSKIPNHTKEYIKYLELCIQALQKIEEKEATKRPVVATVISSSVNFLTDYRDVIANSKRKREG